MIEIENLYKSFNGRPVLRGVDLHVPTGKITVIIGPSGCGKTVLLRNVIGLISPDRGRVIVDGVDVAGMKPKELSAFRSRFGMLFQSAALFDSMSVFENVAFPLVESLRKHPRPVDVERVVEEKLALVGLSGEGGKMPGELSGGMRKRVGLARAIVLEPSIILYDEPTTGLDPVMAQSIDNLILSMQRRLSITSVVISHDIDSALRVADQIAMIHDGQIIECTSPDKFLRSTNPIVHRFLEAGTEGLRGEREG